MCMRCFCILLSAAACLATTTQATNTAYNWHHVMHVGAPTAPYCSAENAAHLKNAIYLLYDVNPPEGFNLRRDVYIRLAVFVRQLQSRPQFTNVRLVLPPWRHLYHWKSQHVHQQNLPWASFFDVESLRRYAPVLDFSEFLQEVHKFGLPEAPQVQVQKVFQLLHFEEMFTNGVFHDKFEFAAECRSEQYMRGYLLQQSILSYEDFVCVRFQGSVNLLERLLRHTLNAAAMQTAEPKIFAILNAEHVLHEHWGNREFWRARRSMRFAAPLVAIAADFRLQQFNATQLSDKVQRPHMWEVEQPYRAAVGGAYLCAHLRRGDFVYGREKTTPTLRSAATQIRRKLQELNLTTVFLASDASAFELKNLRAYLQRMRVVVYRTESLQQKSLIKDGGVAIIDQLICAHAHYFLGTYESTFSYRIYEEREILGFPQASTFNTLCKSEVLDDCSKNTVWPIVY